MHRLLILLFLLLLALPAWAETNRPFFRVNPAVSLPTTLTFTVFGDFRPAAPDMAYSPQFHQILTLMKADKPAFAVSVGDAWFGYGGSFEHFRKEIDLFLDQVRRWDVPLYNAFGNHEVTGNAEREEYLKKRFGNLFGSFDFGDAHFIVLDSDEVGREGEISGKQLSWLEHDLDRNRGASAVLVFLHRPLFSVEDPELKTGRSYRNKEKRDALHRLFVTHHVKAVFAGHEHLFDERTVAGIRYYITGGGGAPIGAKPDKGGFFHYLLVTLSGGNMTVKVKKPDGHR